ncbi:hypothetical protein H4R20_002749, partial [Coemansia guatemalensis]
MKTTSHIAWSLGVAALMQITAVAASPPQHVFALHRPQVPEPSVDAATLQAHHTASDNTSSSTKWERIESIPALPNQQLRIKQPKLCDTNLTQYSGYLDTDKDHHFFFWFFEARNVSKNKDAPVILWMNGGPGCSSSLGALMEHGPCRVDKGGKTMSLHRYGWNDQAHIIFIDQPLNVGFSYGKRVFDSYTAGEDVYNFLQLFYHAFPEYSNGDLHIFSESYGGHFVPATAKAIQEKNTEYSEKQRLGLLSPAEGQKRVLPLTSIGIGNGITDPLIQYKSYSTIACNSTYEPVLTKDQCDYIDEL